MGLVIGGGGIVGSGYMAYAVIYLEVVGYHCVVYHKPPNL